MIEQATYGLATGAAVVIDRLIGSFMPVTATTVAQGRAQAGIPDFASCLDMVQPLTPVNLDKDEQDIALDPTLPVSKNLPAPSLEATVAPVAELVLPRQGATIQDAPADLPQLAPTVVQTPREFGGSNAGCLDNSVLPAPSELARVGVAPPAQVVVLPSLVVSPPTPEPVRTASARTELISLPWRLQASDGLSYRFTSDVAIIAPDATGHEAPLVQPLHRAPMDLPSRMSLRASSPISDEREVSSIRPAPSWRIDRSSLEEPLTLGAEISASRPGWAPLLMWPQRLLRWLADDQGTTAWVRDYQLDSSKAQTLVASLCCLADQQNVSLRRIMLNGHELWRSPIFN